MIHVAVGVITNDSAQVLLTRRPLQSDGGGLWEFPGGKSEPNESFLDALVRELREEIGITVLQARSLIDTPYDYGHQKVMLHVFHVSAFSGEPFLQENQLAMEWVNKDQLDHYEMPKGNDPIKVAVSKL